MPCVVCLHKKQSVRQYLPIYRRKENVAKTNLWKIFIFNYELLRRACSSDERTCFFFSQHLHYNYKHAYRWYSYWDVNKTIRSMWTFWKGWNTSQYKLDFNRSTPGLANFTSIFWKILVRVEIWNIQIPKTKSDSRKPKSRKIEI